MASTVEALAAGEAKGQRATAKLLSLPPGIVSPSGMATNRSLEAVPDTRPTLETSMSKAAPSVPDALTLGEALRRSNPLASLRRRLDESARRFAAIQSCIPPGLMAHVAQGPIDDEGWTLIAANANVAAKLRHLQPRLEEQLLRRGFPSLAVRIKVRAA